MRNLDIGSDAIDLDRRPSSATGTSVRVRARDLVIVVRNAIGTADRDRHDDENLGHVRHAVVRVLVNRSSARSRTSHCLSPL